MLIEISFLCMFIFAIGFASWLIWMAVSSSEEVEEPVKREPPQYRVTMYSGGRAVIDRLACQYSTGNGQIYITSDRVNGFKTGCTCVAGNYVLETVSPKPETDLMMPARIRASLYSNGVLVKAIEAVAYRTDTCRVFLTTVSGDLAIIGGSYVVESITSDESSSVVSA